MEYIKMIINLSLITLIVLMVFILFYSRKNSKSKRDLSSGTNSKGENKIYNGTNLDDHGKCQDVCLSAKGLTDCGLVRKNNEDSFLIVGNSVGVDNYSSPLLCAVADGMGGKDYGELASSEAVEILRHEFNQITGVPSDWKDWLQKAILKAHLAVTKKSKELKIKGTIGTTLVAAVITGEKAIVANVGDSRAYLLRNGDLKQVTKDHSLVSLLVEKELIEPDEIYTHPRRSEIMRFLGQSADLEVDVFEIEHVKGDIIMLCSDGLWEMLRDPMMKDILIDTPNLADACAKLIKAANQAGGKDNITVVNVKVM